MSGVSGYMFTGAKTKEEEAKCDIIHNTGKWKYCFSAQTWKAVDPQGQQSEADEHTVMKRLLHEEIFHFYN